MRTKTLVLVSIMALVIGASVFAAPSTSRADLLVTEIKVTVGGVVWCGSTTAADCSGAGVNDIWTAGLGGVGGAGITLTDSQSLILTQTSGFNFDTSQRNGAGDCNATTPCTTTLEINHTAVTLSGAGVDNLSFNNHDTGGTVTNEATDWGSAGTFGTASLFFGYADNIHSAACNDAAEGAGQACLPNSGTTSPNNLWDGITGGTAATHFIGSGTSGLGSGINETELFHCTTLSSSSTCYDGGAILLVNTAAVPEPSTVLLVGTMVIGLAGWGVRRNRKASS